MVTTNTPNAGIGSNNREDTHSWADASEHPVLGTSYTSVVNLDEENSLDFIPCVDFSGTKYVKIEVDDILSKVEFWQTTVVCGVIWGHPPF